MVFGWGRRKEPEPKIEVVQIRLDEAPQIAEDVREKRSKNIVREATDILDRTNKLILELARIRQDLEGDHLDMDSVDKRLRPMVSRGRKMLMDALLKNTMRLEPIIVPNDVAQTAGELEHRLNRLGNILGKQTRVIHIFAERYALRLKQILEEVDANRESMMTLFSMHNIDDTTVSIVTNGVDTVQALGESARMNANTHDEAGVQIREIDARILALDSEMRRFRESAEYAKLLKMRQTLKERQNAKTQLATQISTQFTSVSRPLGRYEHVCSDKEQSALLRRVQNNPYDVMTRQDAGAVGDLLDGVSRAVASGSISVKDVAKATDAISKVRQLIILYVDRVEATEEELQRLQSMIADAEPTRLHQMEKDMIALQESKDLTKRKAAETMAAVKMSVESIPSEISAVQQSLLKLTGTRYEIVYEGPS